MTDLSPPKMLEPSHSPKITPIIAEMQHYQIIHSVWCIWPQMVCSKVPNSLISSTTVNCSGLHSNCSYFQMLGRYKQSTERSTCETLTPQRFEFENNHPKRRKGWQSSLSWTEHCWRIKGQTKTQPPCTWRKSKRGQERGSPNHNS